jgi:hypothetical protein
VSFGGRIPFEGAVGFLRGGARPPTEQMIHFIDNHKDEFGVEPVYRHLPIAPQTYCATWAQRRASKKSIRWTTVFTGFEKFTPNCAERAARLPAAQLSA